MQRSVIATRKHLLVAAIAACVSLVVTAAPGESQLLSGSVVDDESGVAVAAAEVNLLDSAGEVVRSVLSDTAGAFRLEAPAPDSFTVRIRRLGYATVTSPVIALGPGEAVAIEVRLNPEAVALEPVTVVTRRPAPPRLRDFYDRAGRNVQGRIYTRVDLERMRPVAIRHLIGFLPQRPGCPYQIFLDGLPVDRLEDLDTLAPPHEIEGIEIYRSALGIPPEFYRPGVCGLVLVWRKPYGEGGKPLTWTRVFIAAGLILLAVVALR